MSVLSLTTLVLLALCVSCRVWLLRRQMRSVRRARERVPEAFAEAVPLPAHEKASDYTVAHARLGIVDAVIDALLLVALVWGGLIGWIDGAWRQAGLDGLGLGMAVIVSVYLLSAIIGWPLSIYRLFGIETRFGFNRMTWKLYLLDLLKGIALALVLGMPLLAAVLGLMAHAGDWWWFYAWLVWAAFSLLLTWAYPVLIAPLFNRFQPIPDPELARRIESLIDRCGFKSSGVFVMDGSRRSAHGNAYFTGVGRHKRIVLFDTLVDRLAPPEIEAVLAHELGHFRLHHIKRRLLLTLASGLAGLALLAWLGNQPAFFAAFGGMTPAPHTALLLFFLLVPVFTFWLAPLAAAWSRRHEFEADRFATSHAAAGDLASALVKLYKDNATTLVPDSLYSAFFDSHPPAPVRIARLRERARA